MTQNEAATDQLVLRPFEERDFYPLVDIIARTWLATYPGRAGELASTVELCDYLSHATWSLVAERGGRLLGAVLLAEKDGAVEGAEEWLKRAAEAEREAALSAEFTRAVDLEMAGVVEGSGLALDFEQSGAEETDAVVKLLIVDPDAKGLGVGGALFRAVRDRLRERGAKGYYLVTDDACDFAFYEHMGLSERIRRRSEVEWPDEPADAEFNVYVFAERL